MSRDSLQGDPGPLPTRLTSFHYCVVMVHLQRQLNVNYRYYGFISEMRVIITRCQSFGDVAILGGIAAKYVSGETELVILVTQNARQSTARK
ncbi:hypothetical protein OK016_05360 [Vibrio chagasii]|nr:hypothetical protein [Vibrio chagasii]